MKKFFTAEEDDNGNITKGIEVYVNPAAVAYCEACDGATWIYFADGRNSIKVVGNIKNVVCTLERHQ